MIRKYRYLLTAAAAVGAAGLLTFAARNDFGLGRNMEIAVNMMRELSLNYVDPVDPDRLMRSEEHTSELRHNVISRMPSSA